MIYKLRFFPEVEEDVISGYVWYESKARGLGEEFLRIFYMCLSEISRSPLLYPKVYDNFDVDCFDDFLMSFTSG